MITWDEMTKLLALMAVFDQRKADELDIKTWGAVAEAQGWPSPEVLQRVITDHYGSGADRPRLTPAAVTDRIRGLRNRAAETFPAPVIPTWLSGADYPAWYRGQMRDHVDRCLAEWAATGTEPGQSIAHDRTGVTLADMAAMAPEHLRAQIEDAADRMLNRGSTEPEPEPEP